MAWAGIHQRSAWVYGSFRRAGAGLNAERRVAAAAGIVGEQSKQQGSRAYRSAVRGVHAEAAVEIGL